MGQLTLNVPTLYGDHHVTEVRRILLEMPGVEAVYASSCFQVVEVTFDESQLDTAAIEDMLASAGYLGDSEIPTEVVDVQAVGKNGAAARRHTKAMAMARTPVSFAHEVDSSSRPLWPCPGMGVIRRAHYEEDIGYG